MKKINLGNQSELARRLGVSPQRVQWWTKHGVPPRWVIPVENETGIPRHVLRPDIYPQQAQSGLNHAPTPPTPEPVSTLR